MPVNRRDYKCDGIFCKREQRICSETLRKCNSDHNFDKHISVVQFLHFLSEIFAAPSCRVLTLKQDPLVMYAGGVRNPSENPVNWVSSSGTG